MGLEPLPIRWVDLGVRDRDKDRLNTQRFIPKEAKSYFASFFVARNQNGDKEFLKGRKPLK